MALHDYIPMFRPPPARFVSPAGRRVYGVTAEFATPAELYHAAERVRDAGYTRWDAYAPFPVHGLDEAMGIKRTKLPMLVAAGAFTGIGLALLMQFWMTAVDYRLMVQGKPYGAWEPFIPITFELGVLFTAFTALLAMLAMNGLPRFNHPLLASERFLRVSDDRFMICIEATDPKFEPRIVRSLLESAGGRELELIEE